MTSNQEIAGLLETLRDELALDLDDSVETGDIQPLPTGDNPIWVLNQAIKKLHKTEGGE